MISSLAAVLLLTSTTASGNAPSRSDILRQLNQSSTIAISERNASYRVLFDAYLDLTEPPRPVGGSFNIATIHPGMPDWNRVASWGEANQQMAEAILEAERRVQVGLPYGEENVSDTYRRAGLYAMVGDENSLRRIDFPYLDALATISAFATAEIYRLYEENKTERAFELSIAHIFAIRQFCDREFLEEKMYGIMLLTQALEVMRDQLYLYRDQLSPEQLRDFAVREIPMLRPDRNRLFMPENDRIVAEALIREVFDDRGQPDRTRFPQTFADVQSRDEPLSQFGAYRRWAMIADVHAPLEASLERLQLIYDDWWRRWRVQEYDPILDFPTEFNQTNAIRYAAVIHSLRDLQGLFDARNQLIVAANGTALAAGLCGYERRYGRFPDNHNRLYAEFVRKITDADPYDRSYGHFRYRFLNSRHAVDTPNGRVWIDSGHGVLYSRGKNHFDNRAEQHTDDGIEGDIIVWPPIRALSREQDLID